MSCQKSTVIKDSYSYYASIGLKEQIQNFLESCPEIYEKIKKDFYNYQFNRVFEDINDGSVMRELRQNNENPFLTLTFCSDGLQLQKSIHGSFWSFMFCLNEIPKSHRFRNLFLAGVWQGGGTVPATSIAEIVVEQLNELNSGGLEFTYFNEIISIKVFTICGIFDSPARCKFSGLTQYNGYYG